MNMEGPLRTFMEVPSDTYTYIPSSRFSTWPHLAEKLALIQGSQVQLKFKNPITKIEGTTDVTFNNLIV